MASKVRSQPYRVDWRTPAKTLDDMNARLSKLWTDADEMFQYLFEDLKSTSSQSAGTSDAAIIETYVSLRVL